MKTIYVITAMLIFSGALACDYPVRSLSEQYSGADVVLLGEVITRRDLCDLAFTKVDIDVSHCVGGPSVWVIKPYEAIKDPWNQLRTTDAAYHNIYIIQGGSNCDSGLQVSQKYLVFATRVDYGTIYTTSMMHGTTNADGTAAKIEIEKLRKLRDAFESIDKP